MHRTSDLRTKPLMAVQEAVKKYAVFSGRATRAEFWWWALTIYVGNLALGIVVPFLPAGFDIAFLAISAIIALAVLIPTLAVGVRRLHDTGRSGWWLALWAVALSVSATIGIGSLVAGLILVAAAAFDGGAESAVEPEILLVLGLICLVVAALITIWSVI